MNKIGLSLNLATSEAWFTSTIPVSKWKAGNQKFQSGTPGLEKLLGSPFQEAGIASALIEQRESLARYTSRLQGISNHEVFFLLGHALAMLKLKFLLRSAPCFDCLELTEFDKELHQSLTETTNC